MDNSRAYWGARTEASTIYIKAFTYASIGRDFGEHGICKSFPRSLKERGTTLQCPQSIKPPDDSQRGRLTLRPLTSPVGRVKILELIQYWAANREKWEKPFAFFPQKSAATSSPTRGGGGPLPNKKSLVPYLVYLQCSSAPVISILCSHGGNRYRYSL